MNTPRNSYFSGRVWPAIIVLAPPLVMVAVMAITGVSVAGDVDAGKRKSLGCQGCHGASGISRDATVPHLAGQQAAYTVSQLKAYKSKRRQFTIMNAITAALQEQDMEDLAAYYASLDSMRSQGDAALAAKGKQKYPMCQGCHGPDGVGKGENPRLAGQSTAYTISQLHAFKTGLRSHEKMSPIVKSMTDTEMQALAHYVATLP